MTASTFIALLRGINVGGHAKIPMAELRTLCIGLGWSDVQTYIQSGNLVFRSGAAPPVLVGDLERAIHGHFGLSIPVIVRSATEWTAYVGRNPFANVSEREPNRVMLALSKSPPRPEAADALLEHATDGERIERVGDALWIHFPSGAGKSKLAPALFDRLVGSPVTMRNWRTVLKLDEMLRAD